MSEQKIDLAYKIIKINTTNFSCKEIEDGELFGLFENQDNLKIDLGLGLTIDKEKSQMSFDIHTKLIHQDDFLIIHTGKTIFQVENLKSIYVEEENNFELPDEFLVQLYALSYSHARALLSVEMNRTIYKDKFYLPVINPKDILKK